MAQPTATSPPPPLTLSWWIAFYWVGRVAVSLTIAYLVVPSLAVGIGLDSLSASLMPWVLCLACLWRYLKALQTWNHLQWLGLWPWPNRVTGLKTLLTILFCQGVLMAGWSLWLSPFYPITNPLPVLSTPDQLLFSLMAILGAPFFEEIIFRGWTQQALLQGFGRPGLAIALTSLLFALLHGHGSPGWPYLVYIGLLSSVLGWARHHSGSLWPGMVAHGLHNATAVALFWWNQSP